MAKGLVVGGVACVEAGLARLDCDCVPSSGCCALDLSGRIASLHLPPGATQAVYLSGSLSGVGSTADSSASVTVNLNRLPIGPGGQVQPPFCAQGWGANLNISSADALAEVTVGGSYAGPGDGGAVQSWTMRISAERYINERWDPATPPDSIQTFLRLEIDIDVVYSTEAGGTARRFELSYFVAENPCDSLAVDECNQRFFVGPLPGIPAEPCSPIGGSAFVVVTPQGGTDPRLSGFDSGVWTVTGELSNSVVNSVGETLTVACNYSLRTEREWTAEGDPTIRTAWQACPSWVDAVDLCQPTGDTCCDQGDCGKASPSFPFRWRRIADATARLEDRTTGGLSLVSYLANVPDIDDTINAEAGECALNTNTMVLSGGGGAQADQFGVSRVMAITGAEIGGVFYGSRVRLTPIPAPGLAKRFEFFAELPILWTQAGQSNHPIGVLLVKGTTVDDAATSTLLTIDTAEFRWNTVELLTSSVGVKFEPGETRPDAETIINGQDFDLVATPTGPGCWRQFQFIPRVAPGDPGGPFAVKTDRTLRLVRGTGVTNPRNLLITIDLEVFVQLVNIAACPDAPALQQSQQCESCGGPIVAGVCQVCGTRAARPCLGCGN